MTGNITLNLFWPCIHVYCYSGVCTPATCFNFGGITVTPPEACIFDTQFLLWDNDSFSSVNKSFLVSKNVYSYVRFRCNVKDATNLGGLKKFVPFPFFASLEDNLNITAELIGSGWSSVDQNASNCDILFYLPFSKIFGILSPGKMDVVVFSRESIVSNGLNISRVVERSSFSVSAPVVDQNTLVLSNLKSSFGVHRISYIETEYDWKELVYLSTLLFITLLEFVVIVRSCCLDQTKKQNAEHDRQSISDLGDSPESRKLLTVVVNEHE